MSLTLYHSTESTCAQKVRIVMAEKRLAWTEIILNLRKGDQFSPEYLTKPRQLNPKAGSQFCFGVKTLNNTTGKLLFSPKPVE